MDKQVVVETLNKIRQSELTAIAQYMAHHYYMNDLGLSKLSLEFKTDSFEEMQHAELLGERILDLDGHPEFTHLKAPHRKGTVEEMFNEDIALEEEAIDRLNEGIKTFTEIGDATSRQLLETIIASEEVHLSKLKQHAKSFKTFGNDYLLQFADNTVQA